jgi:acetyltransferase-like isoleucine patch superfamily enzyme
MYYRSLGLQIGDNSLLGNIECEWPGSVEIGENCNISERVTFWIKNPFDETNRIKIGNNVLIGRNCELNCSLKISIGDNCLIASNTVIVDINHSVWKDSPIYAQPLIAEEVILEDDVWIGTGCVILKGVKIHNGGVIGAGSVVTKSVPAYEIWAGVPAKKIGERKSP